MKKYLSLLLIACFCLFTLPSCVKEKTDATPIVTPTAQVQVVSATLNAASVTKVMSSDTASIPIELHIQVTPPVAGQSFTAWMGDNWLALVSAFFFILEVVLRFTPSMQDNSILAFIKRLFDTLFPSRKVGGGNFQ